MKKCCEKKKTASTSQLDFKKQTPEMQIGGAEMDPLYEKAFLSSEKEPASEYAQNTAAQD